MTRTKAFCFSRKLINDSINIPNKEKNESVKF